MSKHLSIVLITIFCVLYRIEAGSHEVKDKFRAEEIAPDVLEEVPELDSLKISYPAGIKVNLGNVLTPTQVKDQPEVEWEADAGAFYTLLMTGKAKWLKMLTSMFDLQLIPKTLMLHRAKNQQEENSDIG